MVKTRRPAKHCQPVTLDWSDVRSQRVQYDASAVIFNQGDPATNVFYIDAGTVRLSVLSRAGKEAVVAVLTPGCFLGEGCLAGQPRRMATATTMSAVTVLSVDEAEMARQLRTRPVFARAFLTHMLTRNIRIEEDLLDQLFNSTEKRLARMLMLLARYGEPEVASQTMPRVSQELLAEMVGTTRSRVNFFMNKFRKLGFIDYDYNGALKINDALLTVTLRD